MCLFKKRVLSEEDKIDKLWKKWEKFKLTPSLQEFLTYVFEVDNGGHLQYFVNAELLKEDIEQKLALLKQVLPENHYNNVDAALKKYYDVNPQINSIEDFSEVAQKGDFDVFDDYYVSNFSELEKIIIKKANEM